MIGLECEEVNYCLPHDPFRQCSVSSHAAPVFPQWQVLLTQVSTVFPLQAFSSDEHTHPPLPSLADLSQFGAALVEQDSCKSEHLQILFSASQ